MEAFIRINEAIQMELSDDVMAGIEVSPLQIGSITSFLYIAAKQ